MATRKFKLTCPRCDGVGYIAKRYEKQGDAGRGVTTVWAQAGNGAIFLT